MRRLILLPLLLLGLGCSSVTKAYLEADKATFDAIAPEYLRLVDASVLFDADQKARRHNTVDTWKLRISHGAP